MNTKSSFATGWNAVNGHWPVGTVGGEEMHQLTIAEMPSHNHLHTRMDDLSFRSIDGWYRFDTWTSNGGDGQKYNIHSLTEYTGGNQTHNTLPRFMVLAYIMKL